MDNNVRMNDLFSHLVKCVAHNVLCDLNSAFSDNAEKISVFMKAYNRYQEDERDGSDYLFDITNKDDLKFLVEKELVDASVISEIVVGYREQNKEKFFFLKGKNEFSQVESFVNLTAFLKHFVEDVVTCALKYVARCKEYQDLYEHYLVGILEE